jgi:hypothetical protein
MRSPLSIVSTITVTAFSIPAFAQTAAPVPAAGSSGGGGWLWAVLVLALAGAAAWYFLVHRRSLTSRTTDVSHDRVAGLSLNR